MTKGERLKRKGKYWEAARWYENQGQVDEAVRCYVQAGGYKSAIECLLKADLIDKALSLSPGGDSIDKASHVFRNYIEAMERRGQLTQAMRCLLRADCRLSCADWAKLKEYFRGKAQSQEQHRIWANILMADIDRDRTDGICREPRWKEALAFVRGADREKAIEIFETYIVKPEKSEGGRNYSCYSPDQEELKRDVHLLIEFVCHKYIEREKALRLIRILAFYKPELPNPLLGKLAKFFLRPIRVECLMDENGEPMKGLKLLNAQEVYGIHEASEIYEKIGEKDPGIEKAIIGYAESIERYDWVLYSLERFGRFEEALALLDEASPLVIWPDEQDPEKVAKMYREKFEFKIKRRK